MEQLSVDLIAVIAGIELQDKEELEVEARIWNIDAQSFHTLEASLRNSDWKVVTELTRSTSATIEEGVTARIIEWLDQKRAPLYQFKKHVWHGDDKNLSIRYSVEVELEVSVDEIPEKVKWTRIVTRERTRYARDSVAIDLTVLTYEDEHREWQVEVELLDFDQSKELFKTAIEVARIARNTEFLWTTAERNTVLKSINTLIRSTDMTQLQLPYTRPLQWSDMNWERMMVQNKYHMSGKADGERRVLWFDPHGVWLVSHTLKFNLVSREQTAYNGCLFDGEWVPSLDLFLIWDAISLPPLNVSTTWNSYDKRRKAGKQKLHHAQFNKLIVKWKKTVLCEDADQWFSTVNQILDHTAYPIDGIVLIPEKGLWSDNVTTIKWKAPSRLTADFYVDKAHKLYVWKGKLVPFAERIVANELLEKTRLPAILECAWNGTAFEAVKVRADRERPNGLKVAYDTRELLRDPILEADIRGQTLKLAFKYHNRIKRNLFDEAKSKSTLLDIGSGRGGSVNLSWSHYKHIIAVEPDASNRVELERRIGASGQQTKVTVLPVKGEATEIIRKTVFETFETGRVGVIALMLSLSFFWSDPTTLHALIETITSCTDSGSELIFLTIDGRCTAQLFHPALGGIARDKIVFANATYELKEGQVTIDHPGSIVGKQQEWLVNLAEFEALLRPFGFEYVKKSWTRAEEEKFLPHDARVYSSMYSYGRMVRRSPKYTSIVRPLEPIFSKSLERRGFRSLPVSWLDEEGNVRTEIAVGDDEWLPLTTSLASDLVRIAVIADGSCILHALLKAVYVPYQNNESAAYRISLAERVRREMARMLSPEIWAAIDDGELIKRVTEMVEPRLSKGKMFDYTLNGMKRMLNSDYWMGDETYSLLATIFNCNILFWFGTDSEIYADDWVWDTDKPVVMLVNNGHHCELIGKRREGVIQTVWSKADPFLAMVKGRFQHLPQRHALRLSI